MGSSRGSTGVRRRWLVPLAAVLLSALPAAVGGLPPVRAGSDGACVGGVVGVVAHADDDLLFQSPDTLHDVQAQRCVLTVYVTAGDAGRGPSRWKNREEGARAAYARMAGVANSWTTSRLNVARKRIQVETLVGAPEVSLAFLRIPDGSPSGSGFAQFGHQSLRKLWEGTIPAVSAVDGSETFTGVSLTATLAGLMERREPVTVRALDFTGSFGSQDHADHHASALYTLAASRAYRSPHTLVAYQGYPAARRPANVTGDDLAAKRAAFSAYVADDDTIQLTWPLWGAWRARLRREYLVDSIPTGNAAREPGVTVTASSERASTGQGAAKAVDGRALGNPLDESGEWATVRGRAGSWIQVSFASARAVDGVVLYDRPNLTDQVVAATLRFSDGSSVAVGPLADNGSGVTVRFPEHATSWVRFEVGAVSETTRNVGLSEFEILSASSDAP